MDSNKIHLLGVYLRGIAMGAADIIPGVSGGTIAFITGIYEELLSSIKSVNFAALTVLMKRGPLACWQHINGSFLLALLIGILTSVFSFAHVITYLLEAFPLFVWSFFFGLICASSIFIAKQLKQWDLASFSVFSLGVVAAYFIGQMQPSEFQPSLLMVFGAGAIAICAMILPGVSGSFILVLLGLYNHILAAVRDFQWLMLLSFAAGCALGLLSFSYLLSWLFQRYHDLTLASLTGFLVGSLNLVWPWKQVSSFYESSSGEKMAFVSHNVTPQTYQLVTGLESNTLICMFLMFSGGLVIVVMEYAGTKFEKQIEK